MAAKRLPGVLCNSLWKKSLSGCCRMSLMRVSTQTTHKNSMRLFFPLTKTATLKSVQWTPTAKLCTTVELDAEIRDRVFAAIRQYDKISPKASELTVDTRFKEDLSMDSLDHVEMITLVEDEFGIEIPDSQMEKMDTPAKIIQYLGSISLPEPE